MMMKLFSRTQPLKYGFASAAAIDYYSLLGIDRAATTEQIREAYAKATKNVDPDSNSALFNRISEAFVILTDIKARDAYDSLMKSRRSSYINDPTEKSRPNSYLADRKEIRRKQLAKEFNLDEFGRYKGGLPQKKGKTRGNALEQIGVLHHMNDFEYQKDMFPEYNRVDGATAESFKNFHQDEREYRTMKKTWNTMSVDYQFFTFKNTRFNYWAYTRFFIIVFLLLPPILRFETSFWKQISKNIGDQHKAEKAEKERKLAAEKAAEELAKKSVQNVEGQSA